MALLGGSLGSRAGLSLPSRQLWSRDHALPPREAAKLGLCNCATGIQDDEDLDRMGDLYLVAKEAKPLGGGRPISVSHMQGRSRAYDLSAGLALGDVAISIGYTDRCDMVVATGLAADQPTQASEAIILQFLNSAPALRWAETSLGL